MTAQDVLSRPQTGPASQVGQSPPLTPSQAKCLDDALTLLPASTILYIWGWRGRGKTRVLRELHAKVGGRLLTAADGLRAMNAGPPDHLEDALMGLLRDAFEDNDIVLFDDWNELGWFNGGEGDRPFLLGYAFISLLEELERQGKKFITTTPYGQTGWLPSGAPGAMIEAAPFDTLDKKAILEHYWGGEIDIGVIESLELAYNQLDGYQLEAAGRLLREQTDGPLTTPVLIGVFANLIANLSNTVLEDVENVSIRGLVGVEEQLETLERTVLLPMMQPDLAHSLGLKSARGVLLYGPPGTGKTTIGRLLAHRMKGKFFILDGTMLSDENMFYERVGALLDNAAASSPSVVFIDDADVIFRGGRSIGFARQLLSKLDGLANESQRDVCLVMTAMNIADMPPALIRSGRAEVWLEMKLPTREQRADILASYLKTVSNAPAFDALEAAALCEGYTPADLRGLIGDARALAAYDILTETPARPFNDYLAEAAAAITARKVVLAAL